MARSPIPDKLESMLARCAAAQGFDLEAVELTPAGKRRVLRVAVDQDGGVTLDDVADVARTISATLDASDVMGRQPYTLEVTSRGTDRPLTLPRHWRRNTDRLVKVTLADDETFEGRITASDEHSAHVETDSGSREVALADVTKAKIQVELNRKDV